MKNKKKLVIGVLVFLVLAGSIYYIFTKQDKNTSFTILEKQWLENNKTKVKDISILKDIPVISYDGNGLLFDFLSDFESVTGLEFNKIAFSLDDEIKSEYSFQVVPKANEDDIVIYSDNYALLTNNDIKYSKLSQIDNMTIGVLESDLEIVQNAFDNTNITFKSFSSVDEMIGAITPGEDGSSSINAIILPKISNLDLIVSNTNLNISYNINEIKQDYIIRLGSDSKLNDIIRKYFKKWKELKYSDSYAKHFSNNYFSFSNTDDKSKAEFKSKKYIYGYVENRPYDSLINSNLYGINKAFLDDFSKISEIDFEYKNFSDNSSLISSFNNGEVDLFFNNLSYNDYSCFNVDLVSNYDENVVVLALPTNKVSVSSVKALNGYDVLVIGDSKISSYLDSKGIESKKYSNVDELIAKASSDSVIVLDSEVYDFYSSSNLKNYKSIYTFDLEDDYSFKVLNNELNQVFIKYFNFYLSFISNQEIANIGYSNILSVTSVHSYKGIIIAFVSFIVLALIGLLIYQKKKDNSFKKVISKDNKIKYIDVLTSLKNRNYLNDNIDLWDESLIYPQGIVIVDLNNIAYINDNYGHAEGDKVIKEAANILIKLQISNTEIIRTNGNEFLIYMVGYDEKQIVSFIRKLNKEFKELSHSFGAAIGYSIITDEIKTVDDAINEATLDMRNNKEEN